jgi:oxygen-independent coproporphyrinogen-3 oxidase
MTSIYIHIPFCQHKCIYCDFYSIAPQNSSKEQVLMIEHFLAALEMEIMLRVNDSQFQVPYETIFIGGGTPSLLLPSNIENILNKLSSQFPILKNAEITLETNPGTVSLEKLKALRAAGVNRISIGIQSFYDDDLRFLTRIHTAVEARQSVIDAFSAGFHNVGVDLIFSLPNQTLGKWQNILEQAVALSPTHISCYSLIVEPDTPLFQMIQSKQVIPVDSEHDAELYEFTIEFLASHGYVQYEVSNFAKAGFQCQHNLNYWNHTNYLGFGPSAHSFWGNERWWNISDVSIYIEQLNKRILPLSGGEHLTEQQLKEEAILLGLRSSGIDLEQFRYRFGLDLISAYQLSIDELVQRGQARLDSNRLQLTAKGYMVCDEILQSFH